MELQHESPSTDAKAWTALGYHHGGGTIQRRRYSAKECFEKALMLDTELPEAWYELSRKGGGHVGQEQYSEKDCLLKTLYLDINHGGAWFHLGRLGVVTWAWPQAPSHLAPLANL